MRPALAPAALLALAVLAGCGSDPAPEPVSSLPTPVTPSPLDDQEQRQVELRKGLDLEIALYERGIPVSDRDQVIGEARIVCATLGLGDATRDQVAGLVRVDPEYRREFVDVALQVWCPELG